MKNVLDIIEKAGGMDKLAGGMWIKVHVDGYMSLTIEHIGTGPHGHPAISVTHYGKQNGDAMRDPEMCFQYHDSVNRRKCIMEKILSPYYYRNDYLGVEQEVYSGRNENGMPTHFSPRLKKDMESFSRTWNSNLKKQGFVSKKARVEILGVEPEQEDNTDEIMAVFADGLHAVGGPSHL